MRVLELQRHLQKERIDVALFFNTDANLTYFAGVRPENACLAIPSSGKPLLFVPGFEAERMASESIVDVVHVDRELLKKVREHFPSSKVGVVPSSLSLAHAEKVKSEWNAELASIEEACRDLRVAKTPEEIARMTKACAMTDVLFEELCGYMHSFETERDVAGFLRARMAQLGVEPSFPPIVAAGRNGATPHHVPANTKLKGFIVLDFGIIYKNYCSDMTRTVFVGRPSEREKKIYCGVLKVQEDCIKQVMPGNSFEDVDAYAKEKLGKSMIHRVGHSLGIEVHDVQPRPWVLKAGNVVTIEPGTYCPDQFGIRIEDDLFVSKKDPVLLTMAPKSLKVILR